MKHQYVRTNRTAQTTKWKSMLIVGLLAMVMSVLPAAAHAQSPIREPGMLPNLPLMRAGQGDSAAGLFPRLGQRLLWLRQAPLVLHGIVTATEEGSLTIELKPLRAMGEFANGRRARLLDQSLEFTFAVDQAALLFDNALNAAALADVAVGDPVTIVPELAWGRPSVRFLFAGAPQELRPYIHVGRMIEEADDSLLLQSRGAEITVVVDENTSWVDGGTIQERPDELRAGLPLRVLGVEEADGSVRAVIVSPLS